jgi:serine/threonine-protein kinase
MDTEYHRIHYHPGRRAGAVLVVPARPLADRYELRGILGSGANAEVHDGWDLKLNRPVAVKLLNPGIAAQPENRLRFATEAHAAALLSSRHIVVVHDIGEHEGLPFIVMERLPGVSLADHIARGPLSPAFVQGVLDDVLAALAIAHNAGFLHRDVKPGNILFTAAGETKLADFGLAKTSGATNTIAGQIVGTMAYLSPHRLTARPATVADDLYAVGVVGYEALTGQRPFPQEDLGALGHAILHDAPPPLAARRPDAPPGLVNVIERAMARDPAWQFEHAGAMRAALAGNDAVTDPIRPPTRIMETPLPPPPLLTYTPAGARLEPSNKGKLWAAAIFAAFVLAIILLALAPKMSGPATPATTGTPLPPPPPAATSITTTPEPPPQSAQPGPPPGGPPGHHGKKHKG